MSNNENLITPSENGKKGYKRFIHHETKKVLNRNGTGFTIKLVIPDSS